MNRLDWLDKAAAGCAGRCILALRKRRRHEEKRAPWPRWAKTARNFLLVGLLGLVIWNQLGTPLPYTAALRRVERQQLLPKMDHRVDIYRGYRGGGSIRIEWTEGAAITSVYIPADARLTYFYIPFTAPRRLEEGPNLICLTRPVVLPDEAGQPLTYAAYAAVRPPDDSASAVLTLHNDDGDFVVEGVKEGEAFLFYARTEPDENGISRMGSSWHFLDKFTYKLEFFGADGTLLETVTSIEGEQP